MELSRNKRLILVGAVILILIIGGVLVWLNGQKTGKLIEAGNEALKTRNWDDALQNYSQARRRAPNHPDVLYGLVKANVELGLREYNQGQTQYKKRLQEAENLFDQMTQVASDRADTYIVKGDAYFYLGRYVQAQKAYQEALRRNRNSYESQLGIGKTLYMMALQDPNYYAEAMDALQKTIGLRPHSQPAHQMLAEIYLVQNNLNGAIESVNTLLQSGASLSGESLKTIGKVFFIQKKYQEAREYLEKAISLIKSVNEKDLVENRYLLGTTCFYLGDYDVALEHLRQARRSSGTEVYPLAQLAQFLTFDALRQTDQDVGDKKIENAIKTLEDACRQDALNPLILHLLVQSYLRTEQYEKARSTLQTLVNTQSDNILARFDLANLQHELGEDVQAIRNYQEVLKRNPDFSLASYNLGSIFLKRAGYSEAVIHLQDAVNNTPGFLQAHLNLAQAFLAQKVYPEAKKEYEKVLEMNPDEIQALSGLGLIYQRDGQFQEAEKLFKKASQSASVSETGNLLLAQLYLQQGNLTAAIRELETAVKLNSQNYGAQIQLGNAYLETNQTQTIQKAIQIFESLKDNPNRSVVSDALTGLALAMLFQGKFDQAQDRFNDILNLPGLTPKEQSQIYVNIGNAYLRQKRVKEAQENYEKALALDATLAEANYNLGRLFQQQDPPQFADARRKYMMAHSSNPSLAAAQYNLGVLYQSRRDFIQAEKHYREAMVSDSSLVESYLNLANIYQQQEKTEQAQKLLLEAKALRPNFRLVQDALANLYFQEGKFDLALKEIDYPNPTPTALLLKGMMQYREGNATEAASLFKKALAGEGTDTRVVTLTSLGAALIDIGNYPEAERYLDQALLKQNDAIEILNNLGTLYIHTGRYEEAQAILQRSLIVQNEQPEIQSLLEQLKHLE